MALIRTVGHGTATAASFIALLERAGIATVIDVRRHPGSRRHSHFGKDEMCKWLADAGVDYRWTSQLGGRRSPRADSPNVGLHNPQFRAYADHMASSEFSAAVGELTEIAATTCVAVMCSESLWWRCHRRLLADHLVLVDGTPVEHLFHDHRLVEHPVMPCARRDGDHVRYDAVTRCD